MPEEKPISSDYWLKQVAIAEKEKNYSKFLERGRRVVRRYMSELEDDQLVQNDTFSIFWANIGVLKAALYANPPKPLVKREFDDYNDQIGRVAAIMMERLLQQPFEHQNSPCNDALQQAVEDRLVPGLGQVWVSYRPTFSQENGIEKLVDEDVDIEYVFWEDFLFSPARHWREVWWVGRRINMDKKEFKEAFGEKYINDVTWTLKQENKTGEENTPDTDSIKKTQVIEIWCKTSRKVHFVSKGCKFELKTVDDPLKLQNFFVCPKPLLATHTTSSIVPKSDYMMVQTQYVRLQDLTQRIGLLEDAVRVAGIYDKGNTELGNILNGSKANAMIPADNWALFAEKGGVKGVVDWFPLEMIMEALDKLRELKIEAKNELYELTGISDIMRGVSAPRETATAQGLKAQYSSVRLQYIQGEVANFVQEALRIKAEIIATTFQPEIIVRKSLINLTDDAEMALPAVQLLKNDWNAAYRVVVHADTLAIPDYNAERQGRTEFITAMGQFISQALPLAQMEPAAAPFLIRILQWGVASFRSAQTVEGVFNKMLVELQKASQQPKPKEPDPKLIKTNAEIQALNAKTAATIQNERRRTESKIAHDQMQAESQLMQTSATAQAALVTSITKAVLSAMEAEARREKESRDDA